MSFEIIPTPKFARQLKKLSKKYRSLKDDFEGFEKKLLDNPIMGTHLGNNVYKIRLAITSKGKGKSGGARVITYVVIIEQKIYLMNIYDKSDKDSISKNEIKELLADTGFRT